MVTFVDAGIYEIFVGHKNFYFGKQPEPLPGTETVSNEICLYFYSLFKQKQ